MNTAAPIVTIFGGSGFVGRHIASKMAQAGWRVRVAVRRPNEALFVKPYGEVGQVEPILANIRDDASVRAAIEGASAVVYSVGVLESKGKQTFTAVQAEGPGRVARIAAETGVDKLVLISAIGADETSASAYARSKAEGEAAAQDAFPEAVILRPSIIFGTDDNFFNRFAAMGRIFPIVPVVGGDSRFQPVYVDDVAEAATRALTTDIAAGVYELGGPDVATLKDLVSETLRLAGRRKAVINVPFWFARLKALGFEIFAKLLGGLFPAILTRDQVAQLENDNVVAEGAAGFEAFDITPVAMDTIIEDYLASWRPHGQYDAITASASNVRA